MCSRGLQTLGNTLYGFHILRRKIYGSIKHVVIVRAINSLIPRSALEEKLTTKLKSFVIVLGGEEETSIKSQYDQEMSQFSINNRLLEIVREDSECSVYVTKMDRVTSELLRALQLISTQRFFKMFSRIIHDVNMYSALALRY